MIYYNHFHKTFFDNMKTLAIVGSPRKGGNCDILVNELAEKLEGEKEIVYLNDIRMNFCQACQKCQTGDCIQKDDVNYVIDKIREADLFVFSSPIYFGDMSAQAKNLIDRFYQISQNPDKTLEGTKVVQIFTQANPGDDFDVYIDYLKCAIYGYLKMEVVDTVVARGTTEKGSYDQLAGAIQQIEKIGNDLL
ncbi:MAG: NAD(P)H-dependent oxidoreductase [Methanobrevibacter sp.]|uniref:flavodoxin family protein n=1 Tax=Methanobrevibacter sp. TaxID=66852 RepID=UPI0026E08698|nr:NAD(P)H-dependent oxidoreductase [Methanobrevibacter sp.]MDO5849085.1 NAD(P)H-dependent oxidoreductase [Methanobrevibacter sp.]